ncbi:uncharacterized protein LOC131613841 [Vicia villosa]|uniref:uncharacterized protein LOC131613841 n=1 Tax=Vicia villosa TaxID=3911 RepID=UPI00273B9F1A|nr:uncharacterized protein LOC131613841 [Vicia villosa]
MANNNIPSPDPFLLEQLIEDSTREVTNRRRQEGSQRALAGQRRPRHETSQPQRQQIQNIQHVHGLQQVQNVEQTHPEGHVQNGEDGQTRPQTEPEQLQIVNETDSRDGQAASSFTRTSDRRRSRSPDEEEQINIPEGADPTAIILLKELQRTNRLIRQQGDRIHELERKRRYRSPQRRRHRSRSYSSSRSPPRRNRKRSPSRSRSPARRNRRQRSYSRSPPRKTRKNQKPETTEARSLSPEQEHRGPSKAVQKIREHSPPKDNRKISGKTRTKFKRGRHSNSPEPSDEEDFRSPLSEHIRRVRLPRGMEKPPALDQYDGTTDPDDHIRSIEAVMDYHVVRGSIKCRIFPTTLRKGAMTWYRNLPPDSIHSWTELKDLFLSHFTASRRQPKSEANLEAAQAFIAFEEGEAAPMKASRGNDAARSSNYEHSGSRRGHEKRKDDRSLDTKERRGPSGRFNDYTPLNASRERILAERQNTDFKKSNIRPLKSNPARPGTDKSKYCKYHKSHGHLTEECIHLKDAIETLIKEGRLSRYTKKGEPSRRDDQRNSDEGNSPDNRPLQVALSVTRPEDFIP